MKIQLTKPNKSSPYYQLNITNPFGFQTMNESKLGNIIGIFLTKEQLKQLKEYFKK